MSDSWKMYLTIAVIALLVIIIVKKVPFFSTLGA